ncbi:MAG: hypothetical protein L6Q93_17185, partial [Phycisphaerae bacterium]|nr:hypothetical protein [Phycisphaerae bacterium]
HVGMRWYDPAIGRFLQRDPIGIEDGLNVFSYGNSSPTSGVDPTGQYWWWPNTGIIRYGPSRVGWDPAGKGVYKLAFRNGSLHWYGWHGAWRFGGCVLFAADVGATAGRLVDETFGMANNGFRISDGLADLLYNWFYDDGSGYNPWG